MTGHHLQAHCIRNWTTADRKDTVLVVLIEYFFGMPRYLSSYSLSTDTFTVQMISKILVPHNGPEMSDKAFKKAVELAKVFKVLLVAIMSSKSGNKKYDNKNDKAEQEA